MDYFPLTLAAGLAFCNRKKELQSLEYNIAETRPTLIVSPRRYGKTSLAMNAILQSRLHYAKFDFLSAVNENDVEKIILQGVGRLIGQIETGPRKALQLATDLFAGLNIKLSFDTLGLAIEINKKSTDPATSIFNILERIEKLSEKYKKKIVLFFDEFQHVYEVSETQAIESIIRQIAQASTRLVFIFSGSNRHLLHKIFNDRNRPFYKLCDRITLERIHDKDYTPYLQTAALARWKHELVPEIIEKIFQFTEKHPYYMNLLCSRLWKLSKFSQNTVIELWRDYVLEERSQVSMELDLLSKSQRKLLICLARSGGTAAPRGHEFQLFADMAGTTITQALAFLEKKDYVYRAKNDVYQIIDPMIKAVLAEY